MRPIPLIALLALLPLAAQNPIIFGSRKGLVRSGATALHRAQSVNLLKYSDAPKTGNGWGKPNFDAWAIATVTDNTDVDAFGAMTADTLTAGNATANGIAVTTPAMPGSTYTYSAYVKSSTVTQVAPMIAWGLNGARVGDSNNTLVFSINSVSFTRVSITVTIPSSGVNQIQGWVQWNGVGSTIVIANQQLTEGSNALPYESTTDRQSVANLVSGGAAMQLGTTSGVDTSDPTRRLVGLSFDGVDDRVSNLPAKGAAWAIINCSASHCYGVDSASGSFVDGVQTAGASEFAISTAGGYSGTLSFYALYSRVLTAKEHRQNYNTYIRSIVNSYGDLLPAPSGIPVDAYIDAESGANGDALTSTNIHKQGTALSCTVSGSGFMTISTSGSVSMPNAVLVDGAALTGSPNTRSVSYDPSGSTSQQYVQCSYAEQPNVSAGSFYRTTSTDTGGLSIVSLNITDALGRYLVSHWVSGGLHLQSGESCAPANPIPISPNHDYWAAIRWRTGTPTLQDLYVWDATTWTLAGYCTYSKTGGNAATFSFGRTGSDAASGTGQWYWDNYMVSLSGRWPLVPSAVTVNTPTYDQPSASYVSSVTVAVSDLVPGAAIKYCVDTAGTCTPTTDYTAPVTISNVGTNHLRSSASLTDWTTSAVADVSYTVTALVSPYTSSSCGSASSGSQPSCNAGAAAVGDMVVAFASFEATKTFTSFSTTGCTTGTWTTTTRTANYVKAAIGWALVTGAGTCTTTVTLSAYSLVVDIMSHVVKNVNQTYPNDQVTALVVTPYQPGNTTDAISTGNLTPNTADDLLIGFLSDHTSGTATISAGTNAAFTARVNIPNSNSLARPLFSEDVAISGTTATAAKFTDSRGALDYVAAGALLARKP